MAEAMACGTPVIAFREGSVGEVIDHGVTGFVVDAGDRDAALQPIEWARGLDRRRIRTAFELWTQPSGGPSQPPRGWVQLAVGSAGGR